MREEIFEFLKTDIEGPSYELGATDHYIKNRPIDQFITGILEPFDRANAQEKELLLEGENDEQKIRIEENSEEDVSFNNFSQSSLGYSFFINQGSGKFRVILKFSQYERESSSYKRITNEFIVDLDETELPKAGSSCTWKVLNQQGENVDLKIMFYNKSGFAIKETRKVELFTLAVVHTKDLGDATRPEWDDCYYQVELHFEVIEGATIRPYIDRSAIRNEDDELNALLYRNVSVFALGHGCAVEWKEKNDLEAISLKSTFLPKYDLKPLIHNTEGTEYPMYKFTEEGWEDSISILNTLYRDYAEWVEKIEIESKNLPVELEKIAEKNILKCKTTLKRIKNGIYLIETDDHVRVSFMLMNEAMLNQQLRSAMDRVSYNGQGDLISSNQLPKIGDESTWPGYDSVKGTSRYGKWRLFQLAFILMNIEGVSNERSTDREMLDLIWFPTGGGKTEAYLGLSAMTILYNRMMGAKDGNTEVIMRYTLKLLTAQQFERAAALVCQLEILRNKRSDLGKSRISIGLWVGGGSNGLSPNKHIEAVKALEEFRNGTGNKFVLTKCPCCSREITVIKDTNEVKGVTEKQGKVIFVCYDGCEFNNRELPVMVVDEYLYLEPATILISTVDKFAQLAWQTGARKLIGIDVPSMGKYTPPSLIIQDELHLISGPLGSVVGLYEPIFDIFQVQKGVSSPKVIASTATISMANEQVLSLYGKKKEMVNIFPNPGIEHTDSFFAKYDTYGKGRRYIGIFANSSPSYKTTQYRVWSALLAASKVIQGFTEEERDSYHTLLGYFNSLKDLGHARTLFNDDVPKHLEDIASQLVLDPDRKRKIQEPIELTSDIESGEIPELMKKLTIKLPYAVDVCLASNMISVGLDIPRLSLMTILSQPKSTAEYIQSSSRIGRGKHPGMVFTIYNPGRARDLSHLEHFVGYHSRIYASVEPTGITPFSTKVLDRALTGLLITYIRCNPDQTNRDNPSDGKPNDRMIVGFKDYMSKRCALIDKNELEKLMKRIDKLFDQWLIRLPHSFGEQKQPAPFEPMPLMIPYGKEIPEPNIWGGRKPWPVLTSMRSIDSTTNIIFQTPD
jgi:hypothetical protein